MKKKKLTKKTVKEFLKNHKVDILNFATTSVICSGLFVFGYKVGEERFSVGMAEALFNMERRGFAKFLDPTTGEIVGLEKSISMFNELKK